MTYLDLHCRVKEREVILVKGMVFANRLSSSILQNTRNRRSDDDERTKSLRLAKRNPSTANFSDRRISLKTLTSSSSVNPKHLSRISLGNSIKGHLTLGPQPGMSFDTALLAKNPSSPS